MSTQTDRIANFLVQQYSRCSYRYLYYLLYYNCGLLLLKVRVQPVRKVAFAEVEEISLPCCWARAPKMEARENNFAHCNPAHGTTAFAIPLPTIIVSPRRSPLFTSMQTVAVPRFGQQRSRKMPIFVQRTDYFV